MANLKKIIIWQNISLATSIFACIFSIYALISVNKVKRLSFDGINYQNSFKPIKMITDVEIVQPDGTTSSINAIESHDNLGEKLKEQEERTNAIKQAKQVNKNSHSTPNIENKISLTNTIPATVKNISKKHIQSVSQDIHHNVPMKRVDNNNNSKPSITEKPINRSEESVANNKKIYGNFVVQIGAFKERDKSLQQCQKVKQHLNNKKCYTATTNGQVFRTIVYPFDKNDEAVNFANKFSVTTRLSCLVKKNA